MNIKLLIHVWQHVLVHVQVTCCQDTSVILISLNIIFSYVVSEPYSMVPGNLNWRYRVVDLHIFVNGPSYLLPQLQEILEGKKADLPGLTVRIMSIAIELLRSYTLFSPVWTIWQVLRYELGGCWIWHGRGHHITTASPFSLDHASHHDGGHVESHFSRLPPIQH